MSKKKTPNKTNTRTKARQRGMKAPTHKPVKVPPLQVFSGGIGDHARQGDVMLRRVEALPEGAEKIKSSVIRQGTATGHAHQFKDGADVYRAKDGGLFVHVTGAHADLVHEEHGTIRIQGPAFLQHVQQREFSGEDSRAVMD